MEVLPTGETQGTLSAGLVYTSGPDLKGPEDQPMEDVLSEVHQLLGTGPDCLILKVGLRTRGGGGGFGGGGWGEGVMADGSQLCCSFSVVVKGLRFG